MSAEPGARPRLAFVYGHRWPESVGGAERYYAALCGRLARDGAVTYLTRAHGPGPRRRLEDGVEVVRLADARAERGGFARRNVAKARFALAVAWHLLRHGGRYDVVHVGCFPHLVPVAARAALLARPRVRLVVDWHEVLPRATWRARLGVVGDAGWLVQRLALGAGDVAVAFSRLHEQRLRAEGRRGPVALLPEFVPDDALPPQDAPAPGAPREPLVVFLGRLVAEKRAHLVPAVVSELRAADPRWRAIVFGDGPERERVAAQARTAGVEDAVALPGFAPTSEVAAALARATCLLLPTVREGFGLAVLEAAAHGTPAVLVREPDNAATELIEPGENGAVCDSAAPRALAAAVLELAADPAVHGRTRAWFERARERHSLERAADELRALHTRLAAPR